MAEKQGFGFGLNKIKELQAAFQKAQQIQAGAQELQKELEQMRIVGESSDGLVKVYMSGNQEPVGVEISPDAVAQGTEAIQASVTEAMKAAYSKSTEMMRSKMEDLTSGLELPGL
ncbi:YbaB/EbfC family nucleoid-associated protein [Aphanothece hegewaldii CCALA 016]|uniref:Nucleoid-associated protein C7H19_02235 n=1 Tax=Aphanothece hegewaldii CCALA 016 TaxID=2107694 RepID=A0A2T1M2J6_9CHRO|nr:YbaB/EbfC family nucleoid-associated protein [Aphanothece hegewaldii]PSF38897.1 YbaB/EbfC family nucleoid-associated protein [Aphanothece hegewaldii CCALA 016]